MLQTSMLHLKDVEAHTNYALDGVTQNDWEIVRNTYWILKEKCDVLMG